MSTLTDDTRCCRCHQNVDALLRGESPNEAYVIASVRSRAFAWQFDRKGQVVVDASRYDEETVFEAASMSKPVTALAALKLVERGELAESDVAQIWGDSPTEHGEGEASGPQMAKEMGIKTSAALEESVAAILAKLNVPSKDDIDALSSKIAELNRKISELNE